MFFPKSRRQKLVSGAHLGCRKMKRPITKILIANRGEIALRIIKTCQRLGIKTVALYTDCDRSSAHVELADERYYLGEDPASNSYLRSDKIIAIAKKSHSDAIHPGYGLLSENAEFARLCEQENIIFIGPDSKTIELMGLKAKAKELANTADLPTIPGYSSEQQSESVLYEAAKQIGTPLLIKASAGGGGKGMVIVRDLNEFIACLARAKREAMRAFANDHVILEKYFDKAKHIEVQIFADQHKNIVHLFERECSLQRRYQKVIEEAPSPSLEAKTRLKLYQAATKLARLVSYVGAGTVEFIFDVTTQNFYFLEMNTRLQVEHPVTEMITGLDLVEWQIKVASGEELPLKQEQINSTGHAIEVRIYGEDPYNNFMPSPGAIHYFKTPDEAGVRTDSGIHLRGELSEHYDPLVAKLIAHADKRSSAISKVKEALLQTRYWGPKNNLAFLVDLLNMPEFLDNSFHTKSIEETNFEYKKFDYNLAFAAYLLNLSKEENEFFYFRNTPWPNDIDKIVVNEKNFELKYRWLSNDRVEVSDKIYQLLSFCNNSNATLTSLRIEVDNLMVDVDCGVREHEDGHSLVFFHENSLGSHSYSLLNRFPSLAEEEIEGHYLSPMPGRIASLMVEPGDQVTKGQNLIAVEAMKTENMVTAKATGVVESILVSLGDQVSKGKLLVQMRGG